MVIAIAVSFPTAMSGKLSGIVLYFVTSLIALLFGITRVKVLAISAFVGVMLFAASFFTPVDLVLVKDEPFQISWVRCQVIDMRDREDAIKASKTNYVIVRGCSPRLGIEPSWVFKISIP